MSNLHFETLLQHLGSPCGFCCKGSEYIGKMLLPIGLRLRAVAAFTTLPWLCRPAGAAPSVNVALQASFNSPPFLLELL